MTNSTHEGPASTAPRVVLDALVRTYPGFQLGPLDWRLAEGEVAGLVGPNGAGKSTTINILAGLVRPDRGRAVVLGQESTHLSRSVRARIGLVRDEPALPDHAIAGDLLRSTARFYPSWDAELVRDLLERFRIDAAKRIKALSHGSKVKMHIIMALAPRPDLLLLDEPFSGLDVIAKQDLRDLLLGIRESRRPAMLVSSHNVAEIERLCDTVTLLAQGKILRTCAVAELPGQWRKWQFRATSPIEPPRGVYQQILKDSMFAWLSENSRDDVPEFLGRRHATDITEERPTLEEISTALLSESEVRG